MINAISSNSVNFQGSRYLSEAGTQTVKYLLIQMNKETKPQRDIKGSLILSTIISGLTTKLGNFTPQRGLLRLSGKIGTGNVVIKLNNPPISLVVNPKTKEVTILKKPLFSSWKKIQPMIESLLVYLKTNFNNSEKVKKTLLTIDFSNIRPLMTQTRRVELPLITPLK